MNRNQRKNRPRKKEMSEETWASQLENIKKTYEHGREEKEQPPVSDSKTE